MQLLRLELKGFKSFADKTIVKFSPGMTAIVGPNGSVRVILPMLCVGCWVSPMCAIYVVKKRKI